MRRARAAGSPPRAWGRPRLELRADLGRRFTPTYPAATELGDFTRVEVAEASQRIGLSAPPARAADLEERSKMTKEERLKLGAELHAFWARNYFPDVKGLDRTLQIAERPRR
jgi:hypothetical protein